MLRIVDKFLDEIRGTLAGRKVELRVSEPARQWLAKHGFDPAMGARPLRRLLRGELEDKLATELLFGFLKKGGAVRLGVKDDALTLSPAAKGGKREEKATAAASPAK